MEVRGYRAGDEASLARLGAGAFGENGGYWEAYYKPGGNGRVDLDLVRLIEEGRHVEDMSLVARAYAAAAGLLDAPRKAQR